MIKAMERIGLVNAIRREGQRTPETRKKGKRTIDHIWVSLDLREEIVESGYGRYDEVFMSDHRGCYIRIKSGECEENEQCGSKRVLNSKREKQVEQYLETLMTLLENHKVFCRVQKLVEVRVMTE